MRFLRYLIVSISLVCLISSTFAQNVTHMPPHSRMLEDHPFYNKPIPAIVDTTLSGAHFDIDLYKEKIVVLHFWSLRCAACFKEIPELNLIAEEYKTRNVFVISMMDDSIQALNERIAMDGNFYRLKKPVFGNDKINFEIIPNAKETLLQYKSEHIPFGFPTTYFIKNGELREFSFGYVQSYGNPKPDESNNYFHIKKILDGLLFGD